MAYYATISELIESVKDKEISYRNLHTGVYIKKNDTIIKIPYKSIISAYMPFFKEAVVTAQLTREEIFKYKFKPKSLSYDLYGTTELWSALLELNGLYSTIDFNLEKQPKVFIPKDFKKILNEIMILEGILE